MRFSVVYGPCISRGQHLLCIDFLNGYYLLSHMIVIMSYPCIRIKALDHYIIYLISLFALCIMGYKLIFGIKILYLSHLLIFEEKNMVEVIVLYSYIMDIVGNQSDLTILSMHYPQYLPNILIYCLFVI